MKYNQVRSRQKPIGFKEPLTNAESQCVKGLQEYPNGFLRKYPNGLDQEKYQYRFQDASVNPVANLSKALVQKLIDKGYLELLPEHKFRLL